METVILVGLQASGKTSFYTAKFVATHVHVSKDLFPNAKNRQKRQERLIEEALSQGKNVIVDNTNVTRADRREIITRAKAAGATVTGYYFESKVEECLARNAARMRRPEIPDVAIFAAAKNLECPAMDEGFDRLFYVKMDGSGGFHVSPWTAFALCERCQTWHHGVDDETCERVKRAKEMKEAERRLYGAET